MEGNSSAAVKRNQSASEDGQEEHIKAHVVLRVLAFVATLLASLLMGINRQTRDIAGFQIHASYKSSPAFKFFLVGNALVCAYSLLSLACVSTVVESYLLSLFDLLSMGLLMAAASAATAIAYLGKKGNDEIGWFKVCPYYEKFCTWTGVSLVSSYIGFLLFLIICAISSVYKTRQIADSY